MRTAIETIDALGLSITLRRFAKLTGGEPVAKPWRAAMAKHYYTSDSCRLVFADSDDSLDGEGWGYTPEEAAGELLAVLMRHQAARLSSAREFLDERRREHDEWIAAVEAAKGAA